MRTQLKAGTIKRAREFRDHATDQERRLWQRLRQLKALGCHFRRQVPFRGYFLDFAEHHARLAIEIDGSQHGADEHRIRDAFRDHVLAQEGYRVLRFTTVELREDIDRIVESILREIEDRRPPTRPAMPADLPTRGR